MCLGVTYTTTAQLAGGSAIGVTYVGSLADNMWLSLVDSVLNSEFPCSDSNEAAAASDSTHSGSTRAGTSDKIVAFNTNGLTSPMYAVCYTEALGTTSATWIDSGMRVTNSKLTSLHYQPAASPLRDISSLDQSTLRNRLPQAANVLVTYTGNLVNEKWIALVDSTLNNNEPCFGHLAAVAADRTFAV